MQRTDSEIIAKKQHDALVAKYGLGYWNTKEYRESLKPPEIKLKENVK